MLGISLVTRGRYENFGVFRFTALILLQISALAVFMAFNFIVWRTAPTFGSQVDCNKSTVYVIFGVTINATSSVFRHVILATMISVCVTFILVLLGTLSILAIGYRHFRRHRSEYVETPQPTQQPAWLLQESPKTMRLTYVLGNTAFISYAIISLEQTINRNKLSSEEKDWTFGQIIALFLLLGVANELLNILLSTYDGGRNSQAEESAELASNSRGFP